MGQPKYRVDKPLKRSQWHRKTRFTMSAVVVAESLNRRGLPRQFCLLYSHPLIASSCLFSKGLGMELQERMEVADQILGS